MITKNSSNRIAWIDVESNGKSPRDGSRLLQVACIITDADLNELSDGIEFKLFYTPAEVRALYAAADPNVRTMHENTGLWDALYTDGITKTDGNDVILKELYTHCNESGVVPLGGNSITLDRDFLMTELPDVTDFLSYQSYDMSSVARHFRNNLPDLPKYEKKYTHDALDDIRESIGEARYYSQLLKDLAGGK